MQYYQIVVENVYTLNDKTFLDYHELIIEKSKAVKPGKVSLAAVKKIDKTEIHLEWKPSENCRDTLMLYNIEAVSEWGERKVESQYRSKGEVNQQTLKNLRPNTVYNLSITYIPCFDEGVKKKDYVPRGYWSDPFYLSQTRTKEDVPGASPLVSPGSFEIVSSGADTVVVNVYWQPVPLMLRQGVLTKVRIRYDSDKTGTCHYPSTQQEECLDGSCIEIDTGGENVTSAKLPNLKNTLNYKIRIDVKTSQGYNHTLNPGCLMIKNHTERLPLPEKFVVRYNRTDVFAWWSPVPNANHYTVYWCHARTKAECHRNNALQWQSYGKNISTVKLPFDHSTNIAQYTLAISAEQEYLGGIQSSGLLFSKCSYQANNAISVPRKFRYDDDDNQIGNSLKLVWINPECSDTDYIDEYVILYKKIQDSQLENSEFKTKNVSGQKTSVVLMDLEPDVEYEVAVYSRNPWNKTSKRITLEKKVVKRSGLSQPAKVGVGIAIFFVLILIGLGLYSVISRCRRKLQRLHEGPSIKLPEEIEDFRDENNDQEDYPMLSNVPNTSEVIILQNRENYNRENGKFPYENGHAALLKAEEPQEIFTEDSALGASLNTSRHDYVNSMKSANGLYAAAVERRKTPLDGDVGASGQISNESLNKIKGISHPVEHSMNDGGAAHEPLYNIPKAVPVVDKVPVVAYGARNNNKRMSIERPPHHHPEDYTSGESSITPYSQMATTLPSALSSAEGEVENGNKVNIGAKKPIIEPVVSCQDNTNALTGKSPLIPKMTGQQQDPLLKDNVVSNNSCKPVEENDLDNENDKNLQKPSPGFALNSAGYVLSDPVSHSPASKTEPTKNKASIPVYTEKAEIKDPLNETEGGLNGETIDSDQIINSSSKVNDTEIENSDKSGNVSSQNALSQIDTESKNTSQVPPQQQLDIKAQSGHDTVQSNIIPEPVSHLKHKEYNNNTKELKEEKVNNSNDAKNNDGNIASNGVKKVVPLNTGYVTQDQLAKLK